MSGVSRRRFLTGSALAAASAAVTAGCTGDGRDADGAGPDLDLAATAAALEKLTLDTCTSVRVLVTQGRIGAAVPQAFAEFLTAAGGHHGEHLTAWNSVLTASGRRAVDEPHAQLRPLVDAAMARVADVPAAAAVVLRLEDYCSQTYLEAIPTLARDDVIRTAGQIAVVDHQHQAVLRYLLGLFPVGSGVARGTKAFAPADPGPGRLRS